MKGGCDGNKMTGNKFCFCALSLLSSATLRDGIDEYS